jgi:hypothetical protein
MFPSAGDPVSAIRPQMLLLASRAELPAADRIWGTGGWQPPEQREALDWLTLAGLCGWSVSVARHAGEQFEGDLATGSRWIVLACDPAVLSDSTVAWLKSRLENERVVLIAKVEVPGSAMARLAGATASPLTVAGKQLSWTAAGTEGKSWALRGDFRARCLDLSDDVFPWVTLDEQPVVAARSVGRGVVVTLGFHPSEARDADGAATAMLKHLLIWGAQEPVAWLDFEGAMVLRMDDPGGAQNVHLRSWYYPKLSERDWSHIATDLRQRKARLSVAYVAGWVDDGDATRGELLVDGKPVSRTPGAVYPSPGVRYLDCAGHRPGTVHDYNSEYQGIVALKAAGLGDVELHGYTHMYPDSAKWSAAPDRYETVDWFRELGPPAEAAIAAKSKQQHPLTLGMRALGRYFGTVPTTLISPGDQWTNRALERALQLGLRLVDSYYLGLRIEDRFCWCTHACAPYLDEARQDWFDSGLPVVGYFHDREPAVDGPGWIARCLDQWQQAGAVRFIDFRELAAAVGRNYYLDDTGPALRLTISAGDAPAIERPIPVMLRSVGTPLPEYLEVVESGSQAVTVRLERAGDGSGRVLLPARCSPSVSETRRT